MTQRLTPTVLLMLLVLVACGDDPVGDGELLDERDSTTIAPSTTAGPTTIIPASTSMPVTSSTSTPQTTAAPTTAAPATTTTEAAVPGPAFGPLGRFDEYLFQDPFDEVERRYLQMDWDAERGILISEESISITGRLALGPIEPAPTVTGTSDSQILLEAWADSYDGDIAPLAVVLYTSDLDGWVADAVIDPWSLEAAMLETPEYAAVAPDGPVAVDISVTLFDWAGRSFRGEVGFFEYFASFALVFQAEIECELAEPLVCSVIAEG